MIVTVCEDSMHSEPVLFAANRCNENPNPGPSILGSSVDTSESRNGMPRVSSEDQGQNQRTSQAFSSSASPGVANALSNWRVMSSCALARG